VASSSRYGRSGHIRGLTNTLPLHVEVSYNEYDLSAPSPARRYWRPCHRHLILKSALNGRKNEAQDKGEKEQINVFHLSP